MLDVMVSACPPHRSLPNVSSIWLAPSLLPSPAVSKAWRQTRRHALLRCLPLPTPHPPSPPAIPPLPSPSASLNAPPCLLCLTITPGTRLSDCQLSSQASLMDAVVWNMQVQWPSPQQHCVQTTCPHSCPCKYPKHYPRH